MPYANLEDAAIDAYDNLYAWYQNGATLPDTMQARLVSFSNASLPSFLNGPLNNRPVANWFALILALTTTIGAAAPNLTQLTQASRQVYGVCWIASYLNGAGLITNAQAATLLAAYNTYIATS